MSRDGTGTYSTPATMAVASATASSVTVNSIIDDMSQALTDSINKDGTKSFAANQSMGNNRLTSLAAGTAASDAARLDQVQKNTADRATTVGGTVDAIALAFTPTITAYTTGMTIRWVSAGANTVVAPTVNVDTIGAKTLKKNPASTALSVGDLGTSGTIMTAEYNGTDFIVLNPVTSLGALASLNTVGTSQIDANSVDGTKIALGSDAQGDVMYYNGTDWARLAAGTSGQVLKTNGAGANPSWVTPTAGGMTLLGTLTTTSGGSQTLSGLTLSSYKKLYFVIKGISGGNTGGQYEINSTPFTVSWSTPATNTVSGYMDVDLASGVFASFTVLTGGAAVTPLDGASGLTNASTSITVTYAFTMDAGSIDVYGVA